MDGFLIYEPDGSVIDKYALNNHTIYRDVYDSFLDKVSKCVIKCDGLKGGKGVYVQDDHFNGKEEGFKIIGIGPASMNLFLTPTSQFILGITYFDEILTFEKFFGFVIIWIAVSIYLNELRKV